VRLELSIFYFQKINNKIKLLDKSGAFRFLNDLLAVGWIKSHKEDT